MEDALVSGKRPDDRSMMLAMAALQNELDRAQGCDYCTLLYKISGEDYEISPDADVRVDNNFCPMCGRYLREVE